MESRRVERSVIRVGGSALAVTLPSWWARALGVKPGTKVDVEVMADGSLRIVPGVSSSGEAFVSVVRVSRDMEKNSVIREVVASYLAGFTRIRIEFPPDLHGRVRELKRVLEEIMLGLTLVEESGSYVEYYVAVDTTSIGFWEAIEKEYKATLLMLEDTIDAIIRRDTETLRGIPERDTLVDRLYLYARRKANRVLLGLEPLSSLGLVSLAETPLLVMAVKSIERVADHTVIIAENAQRIIEKNYTNTADTIDLLKKALAAFESSGHALLRKSKKAAETAAEVIDKYTPPRKIPIPTETIPEVALIVDSTKRILGYSLDIAEIVIDIEKIRQALGQDGRTAEAD